MITLNSKPCISVIIPVYNTEIYIDQCIKSVLNQTLKNIEIIFIDDGSTDHTYDKIFYYAQNDKRIKIYRQKNQFAGTARNNGLKQASGEYVYFLDSDDFIDIDCLEKTYAKAKETKADIVLFNGRSYNEYNGEYKKHDFLDVKNIFKNIFNVFDYPDNILSCTNPGAMTKLYRRKFILDKAILFSKYRTSEDIYFTSIAQVQATAISFVNQDLITYRRNSKTSVQKKFNTNDIINALIDIYNKLQEISLYKIIEKSYIFRAIQSIVYTLQIIDIESKISFIKKLYTTFFKKIHILNLDEDYYINLKGYYDLKKFLVQYKFYNKYMEYCVIQKTICKNNVKLPLVSVIIPVFNVEKYLMECIKSIQNQSLQNIEIICINDGSTDSSFDIIKKLSQQDNRISLYSQNNCGLSIARNLGIKVAKGKYIYFIDSDDWLESCALEELYNKAEKENLDLVFFEAKTFADEPLMEEITKNTQDYFIRKNIYNKVYKGIDIFNLMYYNKDFISSACLLFLKTDLCRKFDIVFINKILHEDEAFTFQVCLSADRIGLLHKQYYKRRYRVGSTMTSKQNFENVYGYFKVFLFMIDFINKNNCFVCKNVIYHAINIRKSAIRIYNNLDYIEKNTYRILNSSEYILFYMNIVDNSKKICDEYAEIKTLNFQLSCIKKSISFRIGRFFTFLPRLLRDLIYRIK